MIMLAALLLSTTMIVPPGPLPWPVPEFDDPATTADETSTPTISLSDLQHSDDYATRESDVQDQIDAYITPYTKIKDEALTLAGASNAPDDTSLDIDTGLDPLGDGNISVIAFVNTMGANVGTVFNYARSWVDLSLSDSPSFLLVRLIISSLAFMLGVEFLIFIFKLLITAVFPLMRLVFMLARLTRTGALG